MSGTRRTQRDPDSPHAAIHPYQALIVPLEVAHREGVVADHFDQECRDGFVELAEEVYELTNGRDESVFTDGDLTVFKLPSRGPAAERPDLGLLCECLACLEDDDSNGSTSRTRTDVETAGETRRPVTLDEAMDVFDRDTDVVLGGERVGARPSKYELHLSLALTYEDVPRHYLPLSVSAGVEPGRRRGARNDAERLHSTRTMDEQIDRLDEALPGNHTVEELSATVTVDEATVTELARISPLTRLEPTEIPREYAFSRPR